MLGPCSTAIFVMADLAENTRRKVQGKKPVVPPLALKAVRRINALFEIERVINGEKPERCQAVRQELSAPLVTGWKIWRRATCQNSRAARVAEALDSVLKRWSAFTRFLEDGGVCLSNNAAERALRGIALGRKSWLFCGFGRGGDRAAVMYSLIVTAKMMTWIRRPGSPTSWLASPSILSKG